MHVPITLLGLMLSSVLGAPEKPKPASKAPSIPREDLRYDGKSFEHWRRELLTELKPEKRVEALKALRTFATKGYAAEAAAAAVEVMADYSFSDSWEELQSEVANAASEVIKEAVAAAQPTLLRALKGKNVNRCLFALRRLSSPETPLAFALRAVADLARDKNARLHAKALGVLAQHYPQDGVLDALTAAMKHQDATIRRATLQAIASEVVISQTLVVDEAILRLTLLALRDKEETMRVAGAEAMGGFLSRYPRDRAADNEARDRAALVWEAALYGFRGLPGLLGSFEDSSPQVRRQAVESLGPFASFNADIS